MSGRDTPADHPVWPQAADALAALCHNLMLTTLPQRILIGGGVAAGQPQLFPLLRARLAESIADYGGLLRLAGPLPAYVAPPALGTKAVPLCLPGRAGRALPLPWLAAALPFRLGGLLPLSRALPRAPLAPIPPVKNDKEG